MSFTVKKHQEIELNKPEFLCDYELNKHNTHAPFSHLNRFGFTVIVGKSGSGKTSMLISMITNKLIMRKTYHNILLFMPSASRKSLKKNIFDKNLDPSQMWDEMTIENLSMAFEFIVKASQEDESTLLIIDDMTAYLKDKNVEQLLKDMIWNKRHYRLHILFLVQVYNSISLPLRKSINDIIVFYKPNIKEAENIFEECLEIKDKDLIKDIFNYSFEKKYDWLFIDLDSQKLYAKFDEIIIS